MFSVYGTSVGSVSDATPTLPLRGRTLTTAAVENGPVPAATHFVSTAYTRT